MRQFQYHEFAARPKAHSPNLHARRISSESLTASQLERTLGRKATVCPLPPGIKMNRRTLQKSVALCDVHYTEGHAIESCDQR